MNRRWAGLLVMFVVLLAAVIAPRVAPRQISGRGLIGPIPQPPSVGDCLEETVHALDESRPVAYPTVDTGPCTGTRYGEVVSVIAAADVRPAPPQDSTVGPPPDPNRSTCADAMVRYLGLGAGPGHPGNPAFSGHPVDLYTYWQPVLGGAGLFLAGPSDLQRSMGQGWVACVSYLADASTGSATPYGRSARDTFAGGSPSAAYATCLRAAEAPVPEVVNCRAQHSAEIFGYSFANATTSKPALTTTCVALIKQFTGMPDPTAGGRLTVGSVVAGGASDGVSGVAAGSYVVMCAVTSPAGHYLTGPLMSLGSQPLPLH